jgi:predicted MPP superfamily phosphohydrolase
VELINRQEPEIVLIGGDLFDGTVTDWSHDLQPINNIQAPFGTLYTTGNHEYFSDFENKLRTILDNLNVKFLENENLEVRGLHFIGISHHLSDKEFNFEKNLDRLLPKDQPSILLYHEPVVQHALYAKKVGVDLMLSGHTHGGQIFPFGFITKAVYKEFDVGLYLLNSFAQYTSSGVGSWGPPVRTGVRPEIVSITLKQA